MSTFNDPLLFIQGPPVFHLPPNYKVEKQVEEPPEEIQEAIQVELKLDDQMELPKEVLEESTSIYELRSSISAKTQAILDKLKFLSKPFQRKAYRPLVFHIEGGVYIQGEVENVNDEFVTFIVGAGEKLTYRIEQIEKIVWRGAEMKL